MSEKSNIFLDYEDTGIALTLSRPLRAVFVLSNKIAIAYPLGLETTYPKEQVDFLKHHDTSL